MRQETSIERFKRRIKTRRYRVWLGKRILVCMAASAVVVTCITIPSACSDQRTASAQVTETMPVVQQETRPEVESDPVSEENKVTIYDVPLDTELQLFIVQLCEDHHIEPSIVIAMIQRESTYQADAIGDNGEAFGLMQVQPKWHLERIERLGVSDLLDPYQNVTVGVDYLAEMIAKGNGLEWALMAYNAGATGANKGYGSTYAADVFEICEGLGVIEYALDE